MSNGPKPWRCFVRRASWNPNKFSTWVEFGVQSFRLVDWCPDREHCRFIRNMFNKGMRRVLADRDTPKFPF